jgi:hypothetical protein
MQARRCSLLILIATCLSAFTDQQIETAHQWALKTKDALVACWQQEVQIDIGGAAAWPIGGHGIAMIK